MNLLPDDPGQTNFFRQPLFLVQITRDRELVSTAYVDVVSSSQQGITFPHILVPTREDPSFLR